MPGDNYGKQLHAVETPGSFGTTLYFTTKEKAMRFITKCGGPGKAIYQGLQTQYSSGDDADYVK